MHDKVLGFVRETLLHENLFDSLSVDLPRGVVELTLLQPGSNGASWPDPRLVLTFSGVRDLSARQLEPWGPDGEEVLGIDCHAEAGRYNAVITLGRPGAASWSVRLVFDDLRYQRFPQG